MSAWDGGPPRSMAAEPAAQFTEQHIGCKTHIRTSLGETIKGEVFAFDKTANTLVIQEKGDLGVSTIRLIKANCVKEVVELEPAPSELDLTPLPPVDMNRCMQREAAAIRAAEEDAKKIGVGVSEVAQVIFDGLAKTLPCRWSGKTIVVMDEVKISEPYTPEVAKGPNQQVLQRVRKVLEGERQRVERSQ